MILWMGHAPFFSWGLLDTHKLCKLNRKHQDSLIECSYLIFFFSKTEDYKCQNPISTGQTQKRKLKCATKKGSLWCPRLAREFSDSPPPRS